MIKVEQDFLELMLKKMSFNPIWVGWIMECVKSISYTFLVSGKPSGKIYQGLRQGDLFSPYLFCCLLLMLSLGILLTLSSLVNLVGLDSIGIVLLSHLLFLQMTL